MTATFTDPSLCPDRDQGGLADEARRGTGAGTVTSAPAGINCGADCAEEYASEHPSSR